MEQQNEYFSSLRLETPSGVLQETIVRTIFGYRAFFMYCSLTTVLALLMLICPLLNDT